MKELETRCNGSLTKEVVMTSRTHFTHVAMGKKNADWVDSPSTGLWMMPNWKNGSGGLGCCAKGLKQSK